MFSEPFPLELHVRPSHAYLTGEHGLLIQFFFNSILILFCRNSSNWHIQKMKVYLMSCMAFKSDSSMLPFDRQVRNSLVNLGQCQIFSFLFLLVNFLHYCCNQVLNLIWTRKLKLRIRHSRHHWSLKAKHFHTSNSTNILCAVTNMHTILELN